MNSRTSSDFWTCFEKLPLPVQAQARHKFSIWQHDPHHPSLHFKELASGLWSVRINRQYRALGWREQNEMLWFWIGSHADYDRLIQQH